MIALFKHPRYDFIGRRGWAYAVSITITASALVSLLLQGLRYDLDFTGGTLIQVRFQHPPEASQLRAALSRIGLGGSVIQEFGDPAEYIIRTSQIADTSREVATRRG
jgi:preprotein translocase subunit SecF